MSSLLDFLLNNSIYFSNPILQGDRNLHFINSGFHVTSRVHIGFQVLGRSRRTWGNRYLVLSAIMLTFLWILYFFWFKGQGPNKWMFPTTLSWAWKSLCFDHNVIRSGNRETTLGPSVSGCYWLPRPYLAKYTQLPSTYGILFSVGLYWKSSVWDWIRGRRNSLSS